jgi:hypothetical protein
VKLHVVIEGGVQVERVSLPQACDTVPTCDAFLPVMHSNARRRILLTGSLDLGCEAFARPGGCHQPLTAQMH